MSPFVIALLVAANIGLIYALLALPLGLRNIRLSARIDASRQRLWSALWPLGDDAGWSGEVLAVDRTADGDSLLRMRLGWEGRDGTPIERTVTLEDVVEGERYTLRVVDDTSLDPAFWSDYRETVEFAGGDAGAGTYVTLGRTDRYRGLAFLVFRYFALRRQRAKLKLWAETGRYRKGGLFEHPLSHAGFALLSVVLLWPLFGLDFGGLVLASALTAAVFLHELGHLAAFRLMRHRRVRMIFIPILGGIAIGGRPYDSRFEVAFVALMGAGFSAFLVPIMIAISNAATSSGAAGLSAWFAALAGCAALFNIANLVPVWKFDGGQVLRQLFVRPLTLAVASFVLLSAFLVLAAAAGFPRHALVAAGAVFALLSLITGGQSWKPRKELKPISGREQLAVAAALAAVFAIHGYGVLWAAAKLAV
ncbi:MAG: site-2 protease family protein [Rhizobiaceae bacterium]